MRVLKETKAIVRWYFDEGRVEGVPFYCDPTRIGAFAIEPDESGRAPTPPCSGSSSRSRCTRRCATW